MQCRQTGRQAGRVQCRQAGVQAASSKLAGTAATVVAAQKHMILDIARHAAAAGDPAAAPGAGATPPCKLSIAAEIVLVPV